MMVTRFGRAERGGTDKSPLCQNAIQSNVSDGIAALAGILDGIGV